MCPLWRNCSSAATARPTTTTCPRSTTPRSTSASSRTRPTNPRSNSASSSAPPQPNDAMCFAYHEDLKGHILRLELDSQIDGVGVNPKDPPLAWEYWDGPAQEWLPMQLESDTTGGLN